MRKNNRQMWANSNLLRMLDISCNTKKNTSAEKTELFWFCQKMSSVAECYRRGTAAAKRSPCVNSKPISVGYILGRDPKLKHTEIQARHFKQQIQCLKNISSKKSAKKTTDKCEHTLIRRCWTNLVMQRKREMQNRRQYLAIVNKKRQAGRVVKTLD